MDFSGADVGGGLAVGTGAVAAAGGLGVGCEGTGEAVGVGVATTEGWTGSGEVGICSATAVGWPGSGEVGLCLAAAVVGDNGVGMGDAVGGTISLVGESGVGAGISEVAGPPQAANASAKTTAPVNGNRFNNSFRYVESIAQPAAKDGKMVSLKAANSRWG